MFSSRRSQLFQVVQGVLVDFRGCVEGDMGRAPVDNSGFSANTAPEKLPWSLAKRSLSLRASLAPSLLRLPYQSLPPTIHSPNSEQHIRIIYRDIGAMDSAMMPGEAEPYMSRVQFVSLWTITERLQGLSFLLLWR